MGIFNHIMGFHSALVEKKKIKKLNFMSTGTTRKQQQIFSSIETERTKKREGMPKMT